MDPTLLLVQCLNATQQGLLLFLVASGLTLIFGILGVVNLAHGSMYMAGAYLAYALVPAAASLWGSNFLVTLAVGFAIALAFGYFLEWAFFSFIYKRNHLQQVLMTYGLILVFEEVRSMVFGNDVHAVPIPWALTGSVSIGELIDYPVYRFMVMGACLVLSAGMYLLIQRTKLGMQIRAGAENRLITRSLGIDVPQMFRLVFALGVALAATAGMLNSPLSSVYPGMGGSVLIVSFVIVVIGGIGSVLGAFVAAILVGFVDTFGRVLFPDFSSVTVYLVMAVILLARPSGLLGAKQ